MKVTPLESWIMKSSNIAEKKRELLENYQLNRIAETIRYAKERSRFYSTHLKNVFPDEFSSLDDLRTVPFTYPQQLSGSPLEFLCVPQSEVNRIVTLRSSGTSRADKRVYFTQEDLAQTVDFFKHGMRCLVDKNDRVMVLLPGSSFGSIGDLMKKALSEAGIACFVHGVMTHAEETAESIINNGISCIVGIPIQVLKLSRMKPDAFKGITKVLLSTDYVPQVLINELTDRYGCRVFTHYGMTEMGFGGGVECEALNGYHMREADLYFEIVDPIGGQPVAEGQTGEVVFTTLTRKAMPLIRYRTGDIASFSPIPCACGTFLKTMNHVQGRHCNNLRLLPDRILRLSELDEIILSFEQVLDYTAYLSEENRLTLEIEAVSNDAFEHNKDKIADSVKNFLLKKGLSEINIQTVPRRKDTADGITNSMVKRKIHDLRAADTHDRRDAL